MTLLQKITNRTVVATQLQNRLSDLFASETVLDLPAGNPGKMGEHPYLCYVINLTNDIQFKRLFKFPGGKIYG
jgi:hypothetical protein